METYELASLLGAVHLGMGRSFRGFSIDSRSTTEGQVFVALRGKVHDGHDFAEEAVLRGAVAVLCERKLEISKEVPQIIVESSPQALRKLASWRRDRFKGKVVAIAGSAGKTTTKELVAFLLSKLGKVCKTPRNYNSQIGVPLSIANFEEECDYWVVEMGASQRGEVKRLVEIVRPHVRAITAIGEEHLETFGCLDDVVLGNGEVFYDMGEEDLGVCPFDVSHCYQIPKKLTFGGEDFLAEDISLSLKGVRFKVKGFSVFIPVPSLAVVENTLCALRVLEALGIDWRGLVEYLKDFHPVEGRFRVVRKGELIIIDDTYNANPPSVRLALKSLSLFEGYRVAVLGDMLELGQMSELYHREVGSICRDLRIELCLFYGSHMKYAYEECLKGGGNCFFFEDREELVKLLLSLEKAIIIFKGSRGMDMESLMEGLLNGPIR
ncbi:MAG: UDP-N-acetylmuramoyl-tripeptide--D-alanyl-D-alanine ligase [Aquificaceae bacterium]|nr:UDP-N-acetylmuramoyl-tripeptide--D-alanyl-D-alanine ligase [Aquificaceae bacterium]